MTLCCCLILLLGVASAVAGWVLTFKVIYLFSLLNRFASLLSKVSTHVELVPNDTSVPFDKVDDPSEQD